MARIVDTHVHFWRVADRTHPWIDDPAIQYPLRYGAYDAIRCDYLPDDHRAECGEHELVAAVHLEAMWRADDPVGETRWLDGLRRTTGWPTVAVACGPLDRPDIAEILAGHATYPFVRGVRYLPPGAATPAAARRGAPGSLDDPAVRRGYALLGGHGFSCDLQTRVWHYDAVAELAADFPGTTIVLNHTGMLIDRDPDRLQGWRKALELAARQPNVTMKISGLGIAGERWSVDRNRAVIDDVIAIFGVDRCMFGSNFPVDRLVGDLATIFAGFAACARSHGADAAERLLCGNARRIYRIA